MSSKYRKHVPRKKSKKIFSKTAAFRHPKNIVNTNSRGGIRA